MRALLPAPAQTPLNNYDRCGYQEILIHQTSSPLIRRAVAVDAGLLAELGARTFYESFAADNTPENMAAYLAESFGPDKQAAELAALRWMLTGTLLPQASQATDRRISEE